ncbi:uncharacterized protein LOC109020378 [Juglans regia]|nr:uncharacterized protein LOC109020378 [Juglans regia]
MEDFYSAMNDCGLRDLGYKGDRFTWSNNREGAQFTKKGLDRALGNSIWLDQWKSHAVEVVLVHTSDHKPILIFMDVKDFEVPGRARPFRYEAKWANREDCKKVVEDAWKATMLFPNKLAKTMDSLHSCKLKLVEWSRVTDLNPDPKQWTL